MELLADGGLGHLATESLREAATADEGWNDFDEEGGLRVDRSIKRRCFQGLEQSVHDDAARIKSQPLADKSVIVQRLNYDVRAGRLSPVD
jgi:hypothetical protein